MTQELRTDRQWDEKWREIFNHYQDDLRHAYYMRAIFEPSEKKILEIAAGSFRDMGTLNKWGYVCYGVDFSIEAVERAKRQYSEFEDRISFMNGFALDYANNEFDITFHNGLWIYFNDDEIVQLAREQQRVSRYRMAVTVHNGHNQAFVDYFRMKAETDPLYNIRFFTIDEITHFMSQVSNNIKIIPCGKGKKLYEDDLINIGLGDAKYIRRSFDYHGIDLLETSERLLCVGEL